MLIGLVRHFEVDCTHGFLMNSTEFKEWVDHYDASPVKTKELILEPGVWDKCYCSDLSRALATAQYVYNGDIHKSELLREVSLAPVGKTKIKLPYFLWLIAGRMAWLCSHQSQPETLTQTKNRVKKFISGVLGEGNILLVTHGFLMMQIQQELFNRGFAGKRIIRAKYGEIHVFEKQ